MPGKKPWSLHAFRWWSPSTPPRRSAFLGLEALEDRLTPALGSPVWVDQGPGPILGSGPEGLTAQNNPSAGAVNVIAVHPTDANTLVVGTVNGGIWKTVTANQDSPDWVPSRFVNEFAGSLALLDLRYSPLDANVLFAATGTTSSSASRGGVSVGVLKSTDGGNTWEKVGGTTLEGTAGRRVRSVVPTRLTELGGGQVVLAGTRSAPNQFVGDDDVGVFRSSDGGATFTRLSGEAGSGLPARLSVTDLAADPGNDNRFYAALVNETGDASRNADVGIYRSGDGGRTWVKVNLPNLGNARNLRMAVSEARVGTHNPVFVGLVEPNAQGRSPSLTAVYRSADGGDTWTDLAGPTTQENRGTVGLHFGGQGENHFSIVADRTDGNVVYVGGDAQPDAFSVPRQANQAQFPNSLGATTYSGRLFRGDASRPAGTGAGLRWEAITNVNANGTSPHADSRGLTLARNGDLLEADDGGVYRLDRAAARWKSLNGSLRVTEFVSVAYDPLNNLIVGGAQDNGTSLQNAGNRPDASAIGGGDGGVVNVGVLPAGPNRPTPEAVFYFSSQNFGSFSALVRSDTNQIVGQGRTFLPGTVTDDAGTPLLNPQGGQRSVRAETGIQFVHPVTLNELDPLRLLTFAGNKPFESADGGRTFVALPEVEVTTVRSAVAGAREGGVPRDRVAVAVGTFNAVGGAVPRLLWRGPEPGSTFQIVDGARLPAGFSFPVDVAFDPDNWRRVYVVDDRGQVWRGGDVTNPGEPFVDITGDLATLGTGPTSNFDPRYTSVVVYPNTPAANDEAVFVGGKFGVFGSDDPTAAAPAWVRFGTALPRVRVSDLRYDSTDNLLLAGTLGRGAWTVANLSAYVNQSAAPNQAPTVTAPAAEEVVPRDANLVFSQANGNALRVADPDARANHFLQVSLSVTGGTLRLATTAGLDIRRGSPRGTDDALVFAGPLTAINAALDGLNYTPADRTRRETLTLAVNDQKSGGSGEARTATAAVRLRTGAQNEPPVNTVPGPQAVDTGGTLTFTAATGNALRIADPDAGTNAVEITLAASNGTFRLARTDGLTSVAGVAGIVGKLFQQVLNRPADDGGLTFWVGRINAGAPYSTIAEGIFESNERLDPIIRRYYQDYLRRAADDAGVAFWRDQVWKRDGGPDNVQAGMIGSPEFFASAGGTIRGYVTELYQRLLGRAADADGLAFWTNALETGQQTRGGMVLAFLRSDESFRNLISGWFRQYLDRAPTAAELADYLRRMRGGASPRQVQISLIDSEEYRRPGAAGAAANQSFQGTLAALNAALDGATFQPTAGFTGAATLTLTTNDRGNTGPGGPRSATSTVAIAVGAAGANLPPRHVVPGAQATAANVPLTFSTANNNRLQVLDPDAGGAEVSVTVEVTQGQLTWRGQTDRRIAARGTLADLNASLDGLVFTPALDANGPVTLTITTDDLGNTGTGGARTTEDRVAIAVSANVAPVVAAPDEVLVAPGVAFAFAGPANHLGVSDNDGDGGSMQEILLSVEHGTLSLGPAGGLFFSTGDGTTDRTMTFVGDLEDLGPALDGLVYTPDAGFEGTDLLTITVVDLQTAGRVGYVPHREPPEEDNGETGNGDDPFRAGDPTDDADVPPEGATPSVTRVIELRVTNGSANERYVAELYEDLLGEEGDPARIAALTADLDRGRSRANLVAQITSDDAYHVARLEDLYATVLGRAPDPSGLTFWVDALGNGATFEQVEAALLGSDEFFGLTGDSTERFLESAYQYVLGRGGDDAGVDVWRAALDAGLTRAEFGVALLDSAEANAARVREAYDLFLARDPDAEELQFWTAELGQGLSEEGFLSQFLASEDYLQDL